MATLFPNLLDLRVRLLAAGHMVIQPHEWHYSVRSAFWRLYFNSSAGADVYVEDRWAPLTPGQLHLLPRDVRFDTRCHEPVPHMYVHFDVLGFHALSVMPAFRSLVSVVPGPGLAANAASLAAELQSAAELRPSIELAFHSLILDTIAIALTQAPDAQLDTGGDRSHAMARLLPALQMIERELMRPLSNAEMAAECHMSTDHFLRTFRHVLGQTPRQYLVDQRTRRAAQLLHFTDQSIDQIATATGFPNRSYFTRMFTRFRGSPPARFRRQEPFDSDRRNQA